MVREAYRNRLILGRSAFDVPDDVPLHGNEEPHQPEAPEFSAQTWQVGTNYAQQYNSRGHAENLPSRILSRALRRAQNDVLATVGVCTSFDKNGRLVSDTSRLMSSDGVSNSIYEAVVDENETALFVGIFTDLNRYALVSFIQSLRRRFQTFSHYTGVPFSIILKTEYKYFGVLQFFLAGIVPSFAFHVPEILLSIYLDFVSEAIVGAIDRSHYSPEQKTAYSRRLFNAQAVIEYSAAALLSPLELLSLAQQLGTLSAWPPIPRRFIVSLPNIYRLVLPGIPATLSASSCIGFALSLRTSPMVLFLIWKYAITTLTGLIHERIRYLLPFPDQPDRISQIVAVRTNNSTILAYTRSEHTGTNQFARIATSFRDSLEPLHMFWTWVASPYTQLSRQTISQPRNVLQAATSAIPTSTTEDDDSATAGHGTGRITSHRHDEVTREIHGVAEVSMTLNGNNQVEATINHHPGNSLNESTVDEGAHPSEVRYHRVTALTLFPTEVLAQHIAILLATVACLPLESLLLRSIARVVYSGDSSSNIRHVGLFSPKSWFGYGSAAGVMPVLGYAGRIMLCLGLEAVGGFCSWIVGCAAARWAGRRYFLWGNL